MVSETVNLAQRLMSARKDRRLVSKAQVTFLRPRVPTVNDMKEKLVVNVRHIFFSCVDYPRSNGMC